jgi:hypothetical protein
LNFLCLPTSQNQLTPGLLAEWVKEAKEAENIFNKQEDKRKEMHMFNRFATEKPELFDLSPAALDVQIDTLRPRKQRGLPRYFRWALSRCDLPLASIITRSFPPSLFHGSPTNRRSRKSKSSRTQNKDTTVFFKSTSHPSLALNKELTQEMAVTSSRGKNLSPQARERAAAVRKLRTDGQIETKVDPAFYGVHRQVPPTHLGTGGTGVHAKTLPAPDKSRHIQYSQSLGHSQQVKSAAVAAHATSAYSQFKYRKMDLLNIESESPNLPISMEMSEGLLAHISSNIGKGLWEDEISSEIARPLSASSFCARQLQVLYRRISTSLSFIYE